MRRKELNGRLHNLEVTAVRQDFIVQYHQQGRKEVTHALGISFVNVSPHEAAHHIPQLTQVAVLLEVPARKRSVDQGVAYQYPSSPELKWRAC